MTDSMPVREPAREPARQMGPCPVCGHELARPISSCSSCHTPHHADCWSYNEGCAIFGCGVKPATPPPPSLAARVLPRVSVTLLLMSLLAAFALTRSVDVRVDDLGIDTKQQVAAASWMTTPSARCVLEVVRADEPDVVLFRRHTPRAHYHRLDLPFIKPGETYLVRVTSRSGWGNGETISQLYRAPEPEPAGSRSSLDALTAAAAGLRAAMPPRPASLAPASVPPASVSLAPFAGRDPFRFPFAPGLTTHVRPDHPRGPWTAFDMRMTQHEGQMSWRTRAPLMFCRVLVMRDSTLKGVEKVVDSTTRAGGHFHHVTVDGLEPDTNYQMLVLGFPEGGDPIQSPVLAFRTLP